MNSTPPYWTSAIFNTSAFAGTVYLTKEEANKLYLSIGAGRNLGLIDGITPGIASPNKAVILGSSSEISALGQVSIANVNDGLVISNTGTSGRSNVKYINDLSDYAEIGIRGSLASNPRTLYTYTNGSYKSLMDIPTGDMKYFSNTDSTSSTSGAMTIAGGLGIAKQLYVAGQARVTDTTASSNYTSGCLTLGGGLGVSGNINSGGNIAMTGVLNSLGTGTNSFAGSIQGNSSYTSVIDRFLGIILQDSYLTSCSLTGSGTTLRMQSASSSGVYGYAGLGPNGLFINRSSFNPLGTCNSNSLLDFGSESHPFQINLFAGTYGITAADSATQILSGGTNGIYLGQGSSYSASTYTANLTQTGSFQVAHKLRACGTSNSGFSGWAGGGLEMGWNGTYGEIYAYNRTTLLFKGLYFGQEIYADGGGHVSIGIGPVASSWRLEVGSNTQSVSSYGYLNSGGSVGTSGGSGSVSFSAYFQGRIAVQGEVDVLSDQRLKSNIREITKEEAEAFFKVKPRHYTFCPETNNDRQFGYLAQDLAKSGLNDVVCCMQREGLEEHIDSDGFKSPKDTQMSVSYTKLVALLHRYVMIQDDQLKENTDQIKKLKEILSHRILNANDNCKRCKENGHSKKNDSDDII